MLVIALQLALSQVLPAPAPAAPPDEGPWHDVVGAPTGALAVWDGGEIRAAHDGGPFEVVLAEAGEVDGLTYDDDGTLYATRAGRLGVRTTDGGERWSAPRGLGDALATRALVVRDRQVVWVVASQGEDEEDDGTFVVSRDGGRTFAARPAWPVGNAALDVAISDGGVVRWVTGYEAGCGGGYQIRRQAALGAAGTTVRAWPIDAPVGPVVGRDDWVYVPDECDGEGFTVCAVGPSGALRPLTTAERREDYPDVLGITEGARTWLAFADRIVVAQAGRSQVVARATLPADARELAVAAARPWLLAHGHLYRLEPAGWTRVNAR